MHEERNEDIREELNDQFLQEQLKDHKGSGVSICNEWQKSSDQLKSETVNQKTDDSPRQCCRVLEQAT